MTIVDYLINFGIVALVIAVVSFTAMVIIGLCVATSPKPTYCIPHETDHDQMICDIYVKQAVKQLEKDNLFKPVKPSEDELVAAVVAEFPQLKPLTDSKNRGNVHEYEIYVWGYSEPQRYATGGSE
jgi:hypothetical protein